MASDERLAGKDWDLRVSTDPFLWMAEHTKNEDELAASALRDINSILENVAPECVEAARTLDLGCGIGRLTTLLAQKCRSVVGADISAQALSIAKERLSSCQNVSLAHLSTEDLREITGEYDLVISFGTLPHLTPCILIKYLEQLRTLLAKGGRAILNMYLGNENIFVEEDTFSLRSYDKARLLRSLALLGYKVLEIRQLALPFDGVDHARERAPYLVELSLDPLKPMGSCPVEELVYTSGATPSPRGFVDEEGLVLREVNQALYNHDLVRAERLLAYWTHRSPGCASDLHDALRSIRETLAEDSVD